MTTSWHSVTLATSRVSAPSCTPRRITHPGPMTDRGPMTTPASMTARAPMEAVASMLADGSMTALGWIPGECAGAGCSTAAIRAYVAYGFAASNAEPGQASASFGSTTTAPARVCARKRRYFGFARKETASGPALSSVATCDTRRSGSPLRVQPKRTASSPSVMPLGVVLMRSARDAEAAAYGLGGAVAGLAGAAAGVAGLAPPPAL